MNRYAIAFILVLLAGYGALEVFPLVTGPTIRIDTPENYSTLPGGTLSLSGAALRTETLTLNDAVLLIDESGRFSTTLTLPAGDAILSLTARDRFGRSETRLLTVHSD